MRFVLFTDKTVAQCSAAINERIQAPASASRPALGGWVEKGGRFSLSLTAPVLGNLTRTTHLEAQIEREHNQTIVRGIVPDGAGPRGQVIVLIAIALTALMILMQGQAVIAVLILIAGAALYVPLRGDYQNGDRLLIEIERVLKATPKPPKAFVAKTAPPKPAKKASPKKSTPKAKA